jgi:hypothetical protein
VSMLMGTDGKVSGIAAIVRDESARFAEDRKTRARIAELEALVASKTASQTGG